MTDSREARDLRKTSQVDIVDVRRPEGEADICSASQIEGFALANKLLRLGTTPTFIE
jgi:hypothetical protein